MLGVILRMLYSPISNPFKVLGNVINVINTSNFLIVLWTWIRLLMRSTLNTYTSEGKKYVSMHHVIFFLSTCFCIFVQLYEPLVPYMTALFVGQNEYRRGISQQMTSKSMEAVRNAWASKYMAHSIYVATMFVSGLGFMYYAITFFQAARHTKRSSVSAQRLKRASLLALFGAVGFFSFDMGSFLVIYKTTLMVKYPSIALINYMNQFIGGVACSSGILFFLRLEPAEPLPEHTDNIRSRSSTIQSQTSGKTVV